MLQEQKTGVAKDFWTEKTNPTFPSAPTPTPTPTTSHIPEHSEPSPRQNPFLNKTQPSKVEEEARHAPEAFPEKRRTGDQKKDPRKEFEAGLMGAVSTSAILFA